MIRGTRIHSKLQQEADRTLILKCIEQSLRKNPRSLRDYSRKTNWQILDETFTPRD